METKPKIGIVGAGAMGGIFAVMLVKAGYDVELATMYDSQHQEQSLVAYSIDGCFGEHTIFVPIVKYVTGFTSSKDYIFILTKAYDCLSSSLKAKDYLNPNGKIILLQNLFTAKEVSQFIEPSKLLGMIVSFSGIRKNKTEFQVVNNGYIEIGAISNNNYDDLEDIAEVLTHISSTMIGPNIIGDTYTRLMVNSCVASVGAICGLRLGKMLKYKESRKIFTNLLRESYAVARAMNLHIGKYARVLDLNGVLGVGLVSSIKRRFLFFKLRVANPYTVSGVLRSIENNKRSEIEYLNGFFCRMGDEFGIDTPVNDRIVVMIKEIENGQRTIKLDNLNDKEMLKGKRR